MSFDQLQGLLTQGNPMMDLGLGLLSQSGPVVGAPAPSLGQAFGNAAQFVSQRDQQRFENNAIRGELAAKQNQREAMSRLPGLLSDPNATQDQVLGLLATGAPEVFAQGLMGQYFAQADAPRTGTDYNTFKALNPHLAEGSQEFRDGYAEFSQMVSPEKLMELELLEIQLQNAQSEQEALEIQSAQNTQKAGIHGDSMIQTVINMHEANETLRNSPLASGVPYSELRRAAAGGITALADLVGRGEDAAELQRLVDAYDTLDRSSNELVTKISQSPDSGFTGAQASGLRAIEAAKGGLGLSYGANAQFIDGTLTELLSLFEAGDVPISATQRDSALTVLESFQLGNYAPPSLQRLSDTDLLNLPAAGLTPEQEAALEAEYNARGF